MTSSLDVLRATFYPSVSAEDAAFGYHAAGAFTDARLRQMALDGNARMLRVHPPWDGPLGIENGATGARALQPNIQDALTDCERLGIVPIVIAGIASPTTVIPGTQTVTADVPIGSYVLPLSSVAGVVAGKGCVQKYPNIKITAAGKWGFAGSRIHAVDPGASTITLAAKTTVALAAGTRVQLQVYRYAPVERIDATQEGAQAYAHGLVQFMIDELAERCPQGAQIGLMNEHTWPNEPWANAARMYDTALPAGIVADERMVSLIRACLDLRPPSHIRLLNDAPDKTGVSSISLYSPLPDPADVAGSNMGESEHWYGWNPEEFCYDRMAGTDGGGYLAVSPLNVSSNFRLSAKRRDDYTATYGVQIAAICTECGMGNLTGVGDAGSERAHAARARGDVRRVLSLLGCGLKTLIYSQATGTVYDVIDRATYAPHPAYTALQRMAELFGTVGRPGTARWAPVLAGLPTDAIWPIMSVGVHGSDGAVFFAWQTTWSNPKGVNGVITPWGLIPSPDPVDIQLSLPGSAVIEECVNVITGETVTPTITESGIVRLPITDEVVALRVAAA